MHPVLPRLDAFFVSLGFSREVLRTNAAITRRHPDGTEAFYAVDLPFALVTVYNPKREKVANIRFSIEGERRGMAQMDGLLGLLIYRLLMSEFSEFIFL